MAKTQISLEAPVYSAAGKKAGTITLAESVFGAKWNADLVHQVVLGMQANARQPWAHTKDRSEISGGGRKPWKQKGTGRARHGSSRSPIWRHGGVTFGPRNDKDYSVKINRKMRVNALFSVLSKKYAAGQVLFVNELALAAPKTAEAREIMTKLGTIAGFEEVGTRRKNALYVVLPKMDVAAKKSFQNMGNVLMGTVSTLNPVDVLSYKYLVLVAPEESVKALEAKLAK
ncbi:MAG TPA: 50S ribosomal protein L4 [Candidatus Paceibacterota bacterium]|nr:50S ribosomal protein L4 [Candidatus Paceibacterota bacterium]